MKRSLLVLLILVLFLPCGGAEIPRTDRTDGLIRELLVKLDSTGIYTAIKERKIDAQKSKLPGKSDVESSEICLRIAEEYFNFRIDSSMVYLEKAARFAERSAVDSLRYEVSIKKARVLSFAGLYNESREVLEGIPRSKMKGELLVLYYNSFSHLYHELYSIIGDYLYYGQGDAIKRIVVHYSDDYVRAVDILGNFGYKANGSSGIPKYDYAHPTAAGMDRIASFVYQKVGEWID